MGSGLFQLCHGWVPPIIKLTMAITFRVKEVTVLSTMKGRSMVRISNIRAQQDLYGQGLYSK